MSNPTPILEAQGLRKSYPSPAGDLEILAGLDFRPPEGNLCAIVGASGAGKSTLLHVLGTLDRPSGGTVRFRGEDVFRLTGSALARFRNRSVGFVFQFHHLLPELSARENVALPGLMAGGDRADAFREADALLAAVGLGPRAEHRPSELSGGEQQRVAVARALLNRPILLLADEPSGNLDGPTSDGLHDLLEGLVRERGQTTIVATHDERLAGRADRVYRIEAGRLHEEG